jgi:NAD(P)-dependent dehydrogenase (short-subunit alcohol dehydrogenase family)
LRARKMDGLFALVNNAGGGKPAPVELMDLEGFRSELNSRLLGSAALVQEFLPLLRQGHGRIVWIMTPAIIPTPFVAAIHACDFAANCLARTLNIELKKWKIANIMVRCGGIRTPAGLRTRADVEAVLKANVLGRMDLYQEAFRKWGEEMAEFDKKRTPPLQVARTIGKALAAKSPRKRYSLGYMSKAAAFLELLPQRLADWILSKRF